MDKAPEDMISGALGCRPCLIGASPVCAARRDRLFWFNFPIYTEKDERLINNSKYNELKMAPLGSLLAFWDEGWGPGQDFKGSMPTMRGWRSREKEPPDPRGINIRSKEAIARLKADTRSSAIICRRVIQYGTYNW